MGDPGIFIAIDGIDGSGKTTLSGHLEALLASFDPEVTKEPTADTEWGKRLRMSAVQGRLPRQQEIEYFHKDRLHHIENFIKPHLDSGGIVICDRYVDSTLAFQAHDETDADSMYASFLNEIIVPDVTFLLKCPVEIGLSRISANRPEKSTFEKEDTLRKAKIIYDSRRMKGENYVEIDASGRPIETLRQVLIALLARFPRLRASVNISFSRSFPSEPPFDS